jgi:DNA/RNA-binding domain of Phe-tRNA-synthetase-like protein
VRCATRLPDGRAVVLDPTVSDRLLAGLVVVDGVVSGSAPEIWEETGVVAQRLRALHADRLPSEISELAEARNLYKSFGMEPSRHRPSSEALLRRVLKGDDLYHISNTVDACNLASLSFLLPIGMYDLDRIRGDVVLRTGAEGEEYAGIRKGPVHLAGRPGLFDDEGPFGSPTSDSDRTSVTAAATRLLAVIMATAGHNRIAMSEHVDLLADLFCRHCGGQVAFHGILGE